MRVDGVYIPRWSKGEAILKRHMLLNSNDMQ
jgi:hypothetical protein